MAGALLFAAVAAVFASQIMAQENNLKVLAANAHFAKDVYKVLAKKPGNVFFSPISAHTVLSLAYQGAQAETSERMAKVLRLPEQKSCADGYKTVLQELNNVENVTLYLANKAYVMSGYKLKKSFAETATKSFSSEVGVVDFAKAAAAASEINSWVENRTHDKIHDLIKPDDLDALTRLVLVNAIYFKGNWLNKFDKALTKKEPFYVSAGEKIDVDMMHLSKKFRYGSDDNLGAQILELPYQNQALSMLVILPFERDGIKKVEEKLAGADLTALAQDLYETEVEVSLPRFKIETTIQFKDVLKELGLDIIFDGQKANFSGLLDSPEPLYVSDVIQKAFIEVNEEGAEAAAATGMIMMMRCMPVVREKEFFVADHPFFLALVHDDSDVLFFGKAERPVA